MLLVASSTPAVTSTVATAVSAVPTATPSPVQTSSPVPAAGLGGGDLDRSRRVGLADRVAGLLRAEDRRTACRAADAGGAGEPAISRAALREARGRLLDVEHALRSGIPLPGHGVRLTVRLVQEAEAGAYAPDRSAGALRVDAAAACAALGSITPFH